MCHRKAGECLPFIRGLGKLFYVSLHQSKYDVVELLPYLGHSLRRLISLFAGLFSSS